MIRCIAYVDTRPLLIGSYDYYLLPGAYGDDWAFACGVDGLRCFLLIARDIPISYILAVEAVKLYI